MKNLPMYRLILTLLVALHSSAVFAGMEFEQFRKGVSEYVLEQNKTPNKIIKYSDSNGNVARTVLSPERAARLVEEVRHESGYAEKIETALELYAPVTQNYLAAFNRLPGQYEAEYLDHFDFIYQLLLASINSHREEDFDAIKDKGARKQKRESAEAMQAMPALFLQMLEQQINENKFSAAFTPLAKAKLTHLQGYQMQAELKVVTGK
jgi:hypothetical protein